MSLNILIVGAGVAGPVCAYWLHRLSAGRIKVTIIERAAELRKAGQQIDIRGTGVQIIRRMGVEDAIRALTTQEEGLAFVDAHGHRMAAFPVENGSGFTCDIEIVREHLVRIFYDLTHNDIEYIFGDHVTNLTQDADAVTVTLANGGARQFDLVIGADGMWSKIRRLAFPDIKDPFKSLGQYTAFFSIPYESRDGTFAQWYNAEGGRSILLRPDANGLTRAFLSIISSAPAEYYKLSIVEQKKMMRQLFADAGWEAIRVLDGMDAADDYYMQEIAQIKMPHWTRGRVALMGDAGYCPSVLSGMGTTLAIVGAYVLAGEIVRAGADWSAGLKNYEDRMRPYVTKAQNILPGSPAIANPQTKWGIRLFHTFVGLVAWSRILGLIGKLSGPPGQDKNLPVY